MNGEDVIGTATLVRRVQWMVIVELAIAEAYAPVRGMIFVMGGATLVAVVVAAGLSSLSGGNRSDKHSHHRHRHRRKIEFDSVPGKTTFTVSVPINL